MSIALFHRTTIAHARNIVTHGFQDRQWDLGILEKDGETVPITGIWLSGRPLSESDGVEGDAQLEVTLETSDDELEPFELKGLLWDARFWVAPADFLNSKSKVRIFEVDPKSSWFDDVWADSDSDSDSQG